MLPLTQRIVALAPQLDGWEFLAARSAKEAPPKFTFNIHGRKHIVDPSTWRYVLTRVEKQSFDIELEQVGLPELSDEDRHAAAIAVLDAVLGEEKRLAFIRSISPASALSGNRLAALSKLSAHLDSLCRPAARA